MKFVLFNFSEIFSTQFMLFCIFSHISSSVNRLFFFHFDRWSTSSIHSSNINNISTLQFSSVDFQTRKFMIFDKFLWRIHFPETVTYIPLKYLVRIFRRMRLLSLFIAKHSTKTLAQNQWKTHAKSIKGILYSCVVWRVPRNSTSKFITCFFFHIWVRFLSSSGTNVKCF